MAALGRESSRVERLFTDARICAFGYVKPSALKELIELAKTGNSQRSTYLMALMCMEYWLRAVESRVGAASDAFTDPVCTPDYRNVVESPYATI